MPPTAFQVANSAKFQVLLCCALAAVLAPDSSRAATFTFDPGPIGSSYSGAWASSEFDLDEPLSEVRFDVEPGKLLNLIPDAGSSWKFDVVVLHHGLSQNYSAEKTMSFYNRSGEVLYSASIDDAVYTETGGAYAGGLTPVRGIASIGLRYDPAVPEVGPDATIHLAFNQRIAHGVLEVTAIPEPSALLLALGSLAIATPYARRRW